jgi:hypothetical protein
VDLDLEVLACLAEKFFVRLLLELKHLKESSLDKLLVFKLLLVLALSLQNSLPLPFQKLPLE